MTQTSKQYSLALFSMASEDQKIDEIYQQFHQFVDGVDAMGYKFFLNPSIENKTKHEIIEKVLSEHLLINFLKVVVDNRKFHLLEEMLKAYKSLMNESKNIAELTVYTQQKLTKAQKEKLSKKFEKALTKKILMNEVVQPSIVGGIRVEYEGKVLDETINATLEQLKSSLIG